MFKETSFFITAGKKATPVSVSSVKSNEHSATEVCASIWIRIVSFFNHIYWARVSVYKMYLSKIDEPVAFCVNYSVIF